MFGDQWLCPCGSENIFLRAKCRNCGQQKLEGDPVRPAMQVLQRVHGGSTLDRSDPAGYDARVAAWRRWKFGPVKTPDFYALRALDEMGELLVTCGVDEETAVARLRGAFQKERERGTAQADPANIRVEARQIAVVLMGCGEAQGWNLVDEIGREVEALEIKRGAAGAA